MYLSDLLLRRREHLGQFIRKLTGLGPSATLTSFGALLLHALLACGTALLAECAQLLGLLTAQTERFIARTPIFFKIDSGRTIGAGTATTSPLGTLTVRTFCAFSALGALRTFRRSKERSLLRIGKRWGKFSGEGPERPSLVASGEGLLDEIGLASCQAEFVSESFDDAFGTLRHEGFALCIGRLRLY